MDAFVGDQAKGLLNLSIELERNTITTTEVRVVLNQATSARVASAPPVAPGPSNVIDVISAGVRLRFACGGGHSILRSNFGTSIGSRQIGQTCGALWRAGGLVGEAEQVAIEAEEEAVVGVTVGVVGGAIRVVAEGSLGATEGTRRVR